jgi:hypothetical protein
MLRTLAHTCQGWFHLLTHYLILDAPYMLLSSN